ncbi:MAG: di-trans,poly-cis-decaprenylcistransferase [Candidatus Marinimicrobia bacterium]|nr:di-trans,poly-cis-decaprenylcistransferase [Candidatus Neomarinimicrobiota bacterium]
MTTFKDRIDKDKLPNHIAIIMDGNGRWANEKNMPRAVGHKNGVKSALSISELCAKFGIQYLTLYTLSLENLSRPKLEVGSLMMLLSNSIKNELEKMKSNNVQFNIIGARDKLSKKINNQLDFAISETSKNDGLKLSLALAYSSREEIINCVKLISKEVVDQKININDINCEVINNHLFTYNIPDPDLLIRTGSENRLSNFLLWQSAYTELFFSKKYWPDFKDEDLCEAIYDFQNRDRRFGRVKD